MSTSTLRLGSSFSSRLLNQSGLSINGNLGQRLFFESSKVSLNLGRFHSAIQELSPLSAKSGVELAPLLSAASQ